jgi:hypothetical protein
MGAEVSARSLIWCSQPVNHCFALECLGFLFFLSPIIAIYQIINLWHSCSSSFLFYLTSALLVHI